MNAFLRSGFLLRVETAAAAVQQQPMLQQERQTCAVVSFSNSPMLANFGSLILDGRATGHFPCQAAALYGGYHKSPRFFLKAGVKSAVTGL